MKRLAQRALIGAALALLAPGPAPAQEVSLTSCPAAGMELAPEGPAPGAPLSGRSGEVPAIDTTYTIRVERRRWTERELSASVAAGVAGTEDARWHACAGAWVRMHRASMEVRDAYGTVHLRASLQPLLDRLRRTRPIQNPRPREDP